MRVRALRVFTPALAVAFLVVGMSLALGACGSGDSGGSGDADGVKTYTDPDFGYSFEYPAGWVLNEGGDTSVGSGAASAGSVQVGDPKGAKVDGTGLDGLVARVYELNLTVDESMLPDIRPEVEGLIADLLSQDASWKIVEDLTETSVAGVPGFKASFTFDYDADHPVKTTSYYLFAGDVEYELVVQASTDTWEENQPVFAAFFASFRPGASD